MKMFKKNKYTIIKKALNIETCDIIKNYFFLKRKVLQTYTVKVVF